MIGHARNVQGQHKDGSVFPILLAVKQVRHDNLVLFHGFMKRLEVFCSRPCGKLATLTNHRTRTHF